MADKFRVTSTNKPWLKNPYCFLGDNSNIATGDRNIHILYDSNIDWYTGKNFTPTVRYVKKPNLFTDKSGEKYYIQSTSVVPLSDSACEELINLAIIYACKTVENPRISTETQIKSFEA